MNTARWLALIAAAALGALIGLGVYTVVYARGYSYLFDDPAGCTNCHIMRDNYASWIASSHRTVTCNGCHTPHDVLGKYVTKTEHGVLHSFAFTFEDTQNIRIKSRSLEVVEDNCVACHGPTVLGTFLAASQEDGRCTKCHWATGHASWQGAPF